MDGVEINISMTPEALAKQFWEMDSERQAKLFQHAEKLE